MRRHILKTRDLHRVLIQALGDRVLWHSNIEVKPLDLDLAPPLPPVRVYIYNATCPPGGRPTGEYKIQLRVPGMAPRTYSHFENDPNRFLMLMGYDPITEVFILWDASFYPRFSPSRNVQVKGETVYAALANQLGEQYRFVREMPGVELVITATASHLGEAFERRWNHHLSRLRSQ